MKYRLFMVLVILLIMIILMLHHFGVTFFYGVLEGENFQATIVSGPESKQYVDSYIGKINGKRYILYLKNEATYNIRRYS